MTETAASDTRIDAPSPVSRLIAHCRNVNLRHPGDRLLVVFDVDGTVVDMREAVLLALRDFDREHGTRHFDSLLPVQISKYEGALEKVLADREVSARDAEQVRTWFHERFWTIRYVMASYRPFQGMLDLARWFQLQPGVSVGFNTGRVESQRSETLHWLEMLGGENRFSVDDRLLAMRPDGWSEGVAKAKADAVRAFLDAGYRVAACVDNDEADLAAIGHALDDPELQLIPARTLLNAHRSSEGAAVDLQTFIGPGDLPHGVESVWHGINDAHNLKQFVSSWFEWAEIDVRLNPADGRLVAYHDSLATGIARGHVPFLTVESIVRELLARGKSFKFDLKEGGPALYALLDLIARFKIPDAQLWFNAVLDDVSLPEFRVLASYHPHAIRQCPVGSIILQCGDDEACLRGELQRLADQGMTRFSLHWDSGLAAKLAGRFEEWGFALNIYGVPDLSAFLHAVLIMPRSVTADFNFPEWNLHGRGSGQDGWYRTASR